MRNLFALLLVGLVVYTIISLVLRTRPGTAAPTRGGVRRPRRSSGLVAPDDDPEFLWRLEQKHRQAERDAKGTDPGDGHDTDHPGPVGTAP